mgnify:CR=1 FL=1
MSFIKERPDAILGSLGGQTGLNLVVDLHNDGILDECGVEILGTDLHAINRAEDRELFRALMQESKSRYRKVPSCILLIWL